MTFWDTILGQQLAKTLIKELPKLTAKPKQYTQTIEDDKVQEFLEERVQAGDRYISHFSHHGKTTVVMEKR